MSNSIIIYHKMEKQTHQIFDQFDVVRKKINAQLADNEDIEELTSLEQAIKNRKQ